MSSTLTSNAHSADGGIASGASTWASVRSATAGDAPVAQLNVASFRDAVGDNWYYINRAFFTFDTSSIPDTATILSAYVTISCTARDFSSGTMTVSLVQSTQASSTSLSSADFDQLGTTTSDTETISATGSYNFTVTTSWISLTGYTKLGLRSKAYDIDNSAPPFDAMYVTFAATPVLTVVYVQIPTAPTGVSPTGNAMADRPRPIVSWTYNAPDSTQGGYQVIVRTADEVTTMWDTGTVNSSTASATYAGTALQPGVRYVVYVRTHNGYTFGAWSAASYFYGFQVVLSDSVSATESIPKDTTRTITETTTTTTESSGQSGYLYWVGGAGDWDSAAHWSATSGGAGGAGVPTAANSVIFDANSFTGDPGNYIVTTTTLAACHDMDWSAINTAVAFNPANINVGGSLFLSTLLTWISSGNELNFVSTSSETINPNTCAIDSVINFNGVGGVWTLTGDLTASASVTVTEGTFNAGGFNVTFTGSSLTVFNFIDSSATYGVVIGSGTWSLTGEYAVWLATGDPAKIDFTDSTITMNSINGCTLNGGTGALFHNVVTESAAGYDSGPYKITGPNTFYSLRIGRGCTVRFSPTDIQTIQSGFVANGETGTGGRIYLKSQTDGQKWYITKDGGSCTVKNCTIKDGDAADAIWQANRSTDDGNNTGWIFLNLDLGSLSARRGTGGFLTSSPAQSRLKAVRASGGFIASSGRDSDSTVQLPPES